jgi:hypothetical protein
MIACQEDRTHTLVISLSASFIFTKGISDGDLPVARTKFSHAAPEFSPEHLHGENHTIFDDIATPRLAINLFR